MNQAPTPRVWSPIVSAPGDDFTDLFDFGDLNFPAFDGIPQTDTDLHSQNGGGPMDTSMEGSTMLGLEHGDMEQQIGQQSGAPSIHGFQGSTDSFPDLALQAELFDQHQQQQIQLQNQRYHAQHAVPPTPNSTEFHGGPPQYYRAPTEHEQLHMYNQYRRHPKDQVRASLEGMKGTGNADCR